MKDERLTRKLISLIVGLLIIAFIMLAARFAPAHAHTPHVITPLGFVLQK